MTEVDFQRPLMRGLRAQGCYVYKVPDLARAVTKPFDICMGRDGHFQPIECKLTKYRRQKPLHADDLALGPANFKGRGHQLPRLLRIYDQNQGEPWLAVCVVRVENGRAVEQRAWLRPVSDFRERLTWTIGEMSGGYELVWAARIGWTAPWLPPPCEAQPRETPEE